ncbi:MAG: autoinducer binding domain-containing protein [Mesorhizobium sp.]|uniref:autoinducer binding domain-containing protein n=1 Tax=Mesorhizobium sp. TaxID=1871066 RepID=UPI001ACF7531|nr:autoinducer binding domain-containing protein [Mesorhizobium sp.]MBN9221327.1 autoinducer binding domain-containing protein [Mesorhizobium sp.]
MYDIFNRFAERLASSFDTLDLHDTLAETASSLDLPLFAYLSDSRQTGRTPELISTYPQNWTSRYLESHYQDVDPVILQARLRQETFRWDRVGCETDFSARQRQLMDEASQFGIRCGFTIPIHDRRGRFAALTFTEKNLNIQPTITVRPGWPLRIIVHKDLVLRPYQG